MRNLERFSLVVQCITKIALVKLKELPDYLRNVPTEVTDNMWTLDDLR